MSMTRYCPSQKFRPAKDDRRFMDFVKTWTETGITRKVSQKKIIEKIHTDLKSEKT